jgi:hypothetical protein
MLLALWSMLKVHILVNYVTLILLQTVYLVWSVSLIPLTVVVNRCVETGLESKRPSGGC